MYSKRLVSSLTKKFPELGEDNIKIVANIFFSVLAKNLKENKRIELRKFGVFKLKHLADRFVYNPYDKVNDYVEAARVPTFKCSDSLHKVEE